MGTQNASDPGVSRDPESKPREARGDRIPVDGFTNWGTHQWITSGGPAVNLASLGRSDLSGDGVRPRQRELPPGHGELNENARPPQPPAVALHGLRMGRRREEGLQTLFVLPRREGVEFQLRQVSSQRPADETR